VTSINHHDGIKSRTKYLSNKEEKKKELKIEIKYKKNFIVGLEIKFSKAEIKIS
jgi:hypothetical protein